MFHPRFEISGTSALWNQFVFVILRNKFRQSAATGLRHRQYYRCAMFLLPAVDASLILTGPLLIHGPSLLYQTSLLMLKNQNPLVFGSVLRFREKMKTRDFLKIFPQLSFLRHAFQVKQLLLFSCLSSNHKEKRI